MEVAADAIGALSIALVGGLIYAPFAVSAGHRGLVASLSVAVWGLALVSGLSGGANSSWLGLLLLLRWAWALTLAAVALLAGWFLWSFTTQHVSASLVQGLLNLVFFLYLVRTDVRKNLR